jgi:hypothetical protein
MLSGKGGREPSSHLDRAFGREMTRVELHGDTALHEFVATIVTA